MPLADHFRRLASRGSDKQTKGFSSELRKWLIKYRWPGNIEQLWQVVESLVEMDLDGLLSFDDLSPELLFSGVIKDCSGSLDLIASLSESDAECISKHTGKVSLGGLLSISDAEADLLSQHRRGELMLNGLEALSDTATKSLGNYQGILGLSGLRQLSETAAADLSRHSECFLQLEGLEVLPETLGHLALAKKLAAKDGELKLDGLTTLSVSIAEALASHSGALSLNGLTTLPDTLAAALARHEGMLSLNGLVTLTETAAQCLSKHRGAIQLEGLQELSEAAEQALAQHAEIISRVFDFSIDPFGGMEIDEGIIGSILEANRRSP